MVKSNMANRDILFLNGTSSSGKTTLARILQDRLGAVYLHVSFDHFASMLPPRFNLTGEENWAKAADEWDKVLPPLLTGFNEAVAALANAGNNLIVDHVLLGEHNARQCARALAGHSVLFVGIDCPLPELERREARRGDRPPGLVGYQFAHIHVPGIYDLRVDTGEASAEECADAILSGIASGAPRTAMASLRG